MEKEENNTDEYWFENERFSSFWKTYQSIITISVFLNGSKNLIKPFLRH